MERPFVKLKLKLGSHIDKIENSTDLHVFQNPKDQSDNLLLPVSQDNPLVCIEPITISDNKLIGSLDELKRNLNVAVVTYLFQSPQCTSSDIVQQSPHSHYKHSPRILLGSTLSKLTKKDKKSLLELPTKSSSGNNLMVERDFDTSISPSAAEEVLIAEV